MFKYGHASARSSSQMLITLCRLVGAVHNLAVELQTCGADIRWLKLLGRACVASLPVVDVASMLFGSTAFRAMLIDRKP